MTISYQLPDNAAHRAMNMFVVDYIKNHKHILNDVGIESFYGCLSSCCFAGGRQNTSSSLNQQQIYNFLNQCKSNGIEYRFTFTNLFVEEKHLGDVNGNMQLELANEFAFPAIVSTEVLEEYIRNKYPKVPIISSVTKLLNFEETMQALGKDYYYVVLNNTLNDKLNDIPEEHRCKIELLVDDCCPPNCINRKHCYENISLVNIGQDEMLSKTYADSNILRSGRGNCTNEAKKRVAKNNISMSSYYHNMSAICKHLLPEDIEKASKLGYSHMKFAGREKPSIALLYQYCRYLIKPEYQLAFMTDILGGLMSQPKITFAS